MLKYIFGFLLKIVKLKVIVLYKCLVISSKCSPASSRLTSFVPCPPLATSNAIHLFQFSVPTPPAHFFKARFERLWYWRQPRQQTALHLQRVPQLSIHFVLVVFLASSARTEVYFNIFNSPVDEYSITHLTFFLDQVTEQNLRQTVFT